MSTRHAVQLDKLCICSLVVANCLRILPATIVLVCALVPAAAHVKGSTPAKPPTDSRSVEILSPTEGMDFGSYIARMFRKLDRKWSVVAQQAADLEARGKVVLRFQIQKDGSLQDPPSIEISSGNDNLDHAALDAIRNSAPFEHLPKAFHGPNIQLRFTFRYNITQQSAPHS